MIEFIAYVYKIIIHLKAYMLTFFLNDEVKYDVMENSGVYTTSRNAVFFKIGKCYILGFLYSTQTANL